MGASRVSRFGLLVVVAVSLALAVPAAASEWGQSDYNAARSRANVEEAVLRPANVGDLRFDLAIGLPPQRDDETVCSPAFVPDPAMTARRLYTMYGGDLAAFDTTNGRRLWRVPVELPGELVHNVVAKAGRVYVAMTDCISQSDPSMVVIAFDAATGRRLWTSLGVPGFSSMVALRNRLVVSGSTGGGGGEQLFVLAAATGAPVWQHEQPLRCEMAALVVRRTVIVRECGDEFGNSPRLEGRRIGDGTVRWTRAGVWAPERGDDPGPGGRILLAIDAEGRLTALGPATGRILWSTDIADGSLAVDADRVYASCGDELCALSRSAGATLWSRAAAAGPFAVAGRVLYAETGEMFRARTGGGLGRVWNDGHRLVGVAGGKVVAFPEPAAPNTVVRAIDLYALPPA